MGPIIEDVPISGGKVLGGIICTQVATGAKWRVLVKIVEARMTEFKALFATREAHMHEEIARALAQEREIWQKDREIQVAAIDRERSQFQT